MALGMCGQCGRTITYGKHNVIATKDAGYLVRCGVCGKINSFAGKMDMEAGQITNEGELKGLLAHFAKIMRAHFDEQEINTILTALKDPEAPVNFEV